MGGEFDIPFKKPKYLGSHVLRRRDSRSPARLLIVFDESTKTAEQMKPKGQPGSIRRNSWRCFSPIACRDGRGGHGPSQYVQPSALSSAGSSQLEGAKVSLQADGRHASCCHRGQTSQLTVGTLHRFRLSSNGQWWVDGRGEKRSSLSPTAAGPPCSSSTARALSPVPTGLACAEIFSAPLDGRLLETEMSSFLPLFETSQLTKQRSFDTPNRAHSACVPKSLLL